MGTLVRSDGKDRTRCPKCGSNQTLLTRLNPTKIVVREDLLMFSYGQYPEKYCPKTSAEELFGTQGVILNEKGIRIFISRGFADLNFGHYVYLWADKRLWMTTDKEETESMRTAVQHCPQSARVYIAGLGLGLILLELAHSKKAKEVMVVERDPRIIEIVEPIIRKWFDSHYSEFKWIVLCGDALQEVEKHGLWDWIFFDIWENAHQIKADEPTEEQVKMKATPFLTEKGNLSIWTMVVKEMQDARIDPKMKAKFDKLFDLAKPSPKP